MKMEWKWKVAFEKNRSGEEKDGRNEKCGWLDDV